MHTRSWMAGLGVTCVLGCGGATPHTERAQPTDETTTSSTSLEQTTTTSAPPETAAAPPTDPSADLPEPPSDPTAPPAALSASTDAHHVDARYVAELHTEPVTLPCATTTRIVHPNATVRARLDALITAFTQSACEDATRAAEYAGAEPEETSCTATTATRALIAVSCSSSWWPDVRGSTPEFSHATAYWEIVGDEVRPTTFEAAFLPGVDVGPPLVAGLARHAPPAEEEDEPTQDDYGCGPDDYDYEYVLGAFGVYLELRPSESCPTPPSTNQTIPYGELVDVLRADGPVAHMLRLGAYAHGAAPPPPANEGEPATGPWAIGIPIPVAEAAARWRALDASLRAAVSVWPVSADLVRFGVADEVGLETARAVATALGGSLEAAPTGARRQTFATLHTTTSVNVRADGRSRSAWEGMMPTGTIVTALVDPASPVAATDWVNLVASPGLVGWSARSLFESDPCDPDASAFLAGLPQDARDGASRSFLRVRTTALSQGRQTPALLLIAAEAERSFVSLRRMSTTSCRLGDELASWTVPAHVFDALITRTVQTTADAETLVLLALGSTTNPMGPATWIALRVGTPTEVWRREGLGSPVVGNYIRAPARRGPSGRGFWPAAIEERRRPIVPLHWDGSTLVQDAP